MALEEDSPDKDQLHKVLEMTFTLEELEDAKTLLCLNSISHLDSTFRFGEENSEEVFVRESLKHPDLVEALLTPIDS